MSNTNDNREIRVFISSTFKDMEEERGHLIKDVFPKLRSICQKRSVTFTDIDLRWGITEDQAQDGGAIAICLEEIDRCRPYFIGLIGERYGWTPQDDNAEVHVKPEIEHDVKEWCDTGRSVTEMEMIYGVLKKPEQAPYSYFYLCDSELTKQKERLMLASSNDSNVHDVFYDGDSEKNKKLKELKNQIGSEGASWSVDNYVTVEELGQKIEAELLAVIDKEFPADETIDTISLRHQKHESFARGRRRGYIADESEISELIEQIESKGNPLVVTGEMGVGKSALMATLADRWQNLHPQGSIIAHYAGAGDDSSAASIIRQILTEMNQQYRLEKEIPNDENDLFQALPEWLASIPEDKPLCLILDGVNQYTGDTRRLIATIPEGMGASVRIVVSALASDELDYLKKREWPQHIIQPLNKTRRVALIDSYLGSYNKTLPDSLIKHVSESVQSSNPLYLKILLDELRVDARHEVLSERIEQYLQADTPKALYQQVIRRWQEDYGRELTEQVLSLIGCSRFGLSYDELRHLVDSNQMDISRLIFGMGDHLGDINGLHVFMHDALHHAVEDSLIYDKDKTYQNLICYFFELDIDNDRRLDELARLYHRNKQWNALQALLTNLSYLYWKFQQSKADDLLDEYKITSSDCDITSSLYTEYESFIKKNFVALKNLPSRIYQEVMNLSKFSSTNIKNDVETWNVGNKFDWGETLFPTASKENTTVFSANKVINSFDWSPSGKEIAVLLNDGCICVVDVTTKKVRNIGQFEPLDRDRSSYRKLEWNPSNEGVIGLAVKNKVFFISPDGNEPCEVDNAQLPDDMLSSRWSLQGAEIICMTWSSNGDYLFVSQRDEYDTEKKYIVAGKRFENKKRVSSLTMINKKGDRVDKLNIHISDLNIHSDDLFADITCILSFDNSLIVSTITDEIHKVDISNGKLQLIDSLDMKLTIIGIGFAGKESIFVLCHELEKSLVIDINTMRATNKQPINQYEWGRKNMTNHGGRIRATSNGGGILIDIVPHTPGSMAPLYITDDLFCSNKVKKNLVNSYSLSFEAEGMDVKTLEENVGDKFKFAKHKHKFVAYTHGTEISTGTVESLQKINSEDEKPKLTLEKNLNRAYFKHKTVGSIEVTKELSRSRSLSPTLKYRIMMDTKTVASINECMTTSHERFITSIVELDNKFQTISDITINDEHPSREEWETVHDLDYYNSLDWERRFYLDNELLRVEWQTSSDLVALLFRGKLVLWDVANQNEKWAISIYKLVEDLYLVDYDSDDGFASGLIKWTNSGRYLFIVWDGLLRLDVDSMKLEKINNGQYGVKTLDVQDSLVVLGYRNNTTVEVIVIEEDLPEKHNLIGFSDIPSSSTSVLVDSGAINVSFIADGRMFLVVTDTGELTVWERLTLKCILRYKSVGANITTAYYNHENAIVTMMSQSYVVSLVKLHLGNS